MAMIDQELSEQKKAKDIERAKLKAQLLSANNEPIEKETKICIASARPFQISTHYTEDDKDAISMCGINIRKSSDIKKPKNEEIVHAAVRYFLSLPLETQITQLREDRNLLLSTK